MAGLAVALLLVWAPACGPDATGVLDDSTSQSSGSSSSETSDDSSDDTSSETGEDESSTGGEYCGGAEIFSRPIPLRVVWVVDNSASTLTPYDHDLDPATPELTPRERIDTFASWFFERYPGPDGCHPLAPGLVWAPAGSAGEPPASTACSVDAATVAPDVDSQAPFDTAWAARPPAGGAVALADAYAMAVNSFGGVPEWEQPVIVVLTGSPPACGVGDSETLDARLFQRMNDAWNDQGIQSVVLRAGPQALGTSSEVDGVPDGVDLALYWASLQSVIGSWHLDVGEQSMIQGLFDQASPSYGDCSYDLSVAPNSPPSSPDLVDIVGVNGVAFEKLELDLEACDALTDGAGWIWEEAPKVIRLCGAACAATQCEAQNPWPDNAVEVEVPYLCE